MKNIRTITFQYDPTISLEKTFAKMQESVKTSKPSVHPHRIKVASLESLWLNSSQLKLFSCLVEDKPNSLAQLAQILNKDYQEVEKEAYSLALMGIIRLQEEQDQILRPIALYDRIVFDFSAKKKEVHPQNVSLNA